MADEPTQSIDQRLIRAVVHPVRARILELLIGEKELSSISVAAKLGIKERSAAYHLTALRQCEAIEPARIETHRGAPERFFRLVADFEPRRRRARSEPCQEGRGA